ncbi:alternate-type signal peptide domain-containing protein [Cryobacterium sp. PH29-G1]|uniref:alternate-type signal peptide domain-containing protein n=1 Tax=Cryobacterium sp. PH29-G1 TaxID=3046211 RepID=UPI0024BB20F2|nr:alternate-type signal peptide domain-containing protein [Cryobacterium sp. PH29-G1]MDJ0350922.1 alternate-type signal peptide domain-containing protein [Cryobacterium sp. PH29-G1]
MNKLLVSAIAGAAGLTLLLGGAGTFALWNTSATVAGGTIVAGNLLVGDSGTVGSWTVNGTAKTLSGYKAVPGDILVYTKTMSITATGDNLVATLALTQASITGTTSGTADVALAGYLTKTAVLTATGPGISTGSAPYTVTAATAGVAQNVTVTVTITYPKNAAAGFTAEANTKLGSVSLDNLSVSLIQI